MIRLTLKPGREESVLRRHPWLFSGAIAAEEGDGSDGHAEVLDSRGKALARGAYSPGSQIRARLWTFDGRMPDETLFRERFENARVLRRRTVGADTTGYRLLHSEGDLCPGVILDLYGDTALLELLTEGIEKWGPSLESAARSVFSPERLEVRATGRARDQGQTRPPRAAAEEGSSVPFLENGLRFTADLASGQKTGFYLDQRENRARLRALASDGTVLNLFSYSGGFSVSALAGGARRAVDVDSSERALELARLHRRENSFSVDDADFVRADVFEDVRRRSAAGESWDLIVCDPPALAKRRGDVERAARAYKDVNRLAMSLVAPGGWLLTCSCSGLIDPSLFQKIVFSASLEAGRTFSIEARQGAGPDHPVSLDCPEGEYLKGLWLHRRT
ncbi:MAG: class I SAM-dependent rRNA methyltransferase [Thermoanaerobaculia bacterium]|nr:class I SAM-dependent rRNA methyltransferase [Thermoanaerobaculia bacterium]